ncbi:MAG TPA: DNA-binding transcriptional regulator Fis [Chromatiaceae bacterium]|nr:DNA-binding transcriptional regulator Fis [Chromatiaceae bacterium]
MVRREQRAESLADCVRDALESYFEQLDGHQAANLYQMVMQEMERPLLQTVMEHTGGNQTRAAALLGLSRSTLRKKLAQYEIN